MHSMLAVRSDFSIGESTLDVDKACEEAARVGAKAIALTDTMSVTGLIEMSIAAGKVGIKPIVGCRLRLVEDLSWKKSKDGPKAPPEYFVTLYALSEKGLKALYRLLTLSSSEGHFYMVAKLSFDDFFEALDTLDVDDVAIATSDAQSVILHRDAETLLSRVPARLRASNCFVTLTPANTPYWDSLNLRAIEIGDKLGWQYLVTRPVFYPEAGADGTEVIGAISRNVKVTDVWHWSPWLRDFEAKSVDSLIAECKGAIARLNKRGVNAAEPFAAGLKNTRRLVGMVSYEWKKQAPSLPQMAPNEILAVVDECKKGWSVRFGDTVFGHKPTTEEMRDVYKPRLAYELDVLRKLGFAGYFLLVQDVVKFAKSNGILVGPGRGSVGGSLVAYLMGITDCDPIRFDLLFERFINPDRLDLPDADLDFQSERRHEIVEYLRGKYGVERVAAISNFGRLAASSAIRDVARVFALPEHVYNCSKFVPKEHGQPVSLDKAAEQVPEIAKYRDENGELWKLSVSLEGVMRNLSQHAAGVVVAGEDLVERAVVESRTGERVINWDKRIVEDQGLIKMDVLGLNTLDLISLTLRYIRERHSKRVDLLRVPLNDQKIIDAFAAGQTIGVFQFESPGMRRLLKDLGVDGTLTFDDVVAATALYRPGPMDSGMMQSYVLRKQGREVVEFEHETMKEVLAPTFGVIVYQEQVMKVAQVVAGYTLAEADKLRKIMGKKLPEEMEKQRDKFVDGCVKSATLDAPEATDLFEKIAKFAGYGFNKSHSVEYSLISWWCMWLKTYYTVEFFASALTLMPEEKLPAVLADAARAGIEIDVPDVNISTDRFEIVTDTRLSIPFARVKGLSTNAAKMIAETRSVGGPFASKEDFEKRVNRRLCNIAKITALEKVGAFVRIEPGSIPTKHPDRIRDQKELIPGLITDIVPVHRSMHADRDTKVEILGLVSEYQLAHGIDPDESDGSNDGIPVKPSFGSKAAFMVVFDKPSNAEEAAGKMGFGDGFAWQCTCRAMHEAGMSMKDGYFTALVKTPPASKQVTPAEINRWAPYLDREIDLLKPPVIVLLGSTAVRHFIKDFKGKASDVAGQVIYSAKLDANIVLGFSPGEIYHDPEKQIRLDELFGVVSSLTT